MERNKLEVFLETDEYKIFSISVFKLLSRINYSVFEMLSQSNKPSLLKRNTILNGAQKVGATSIYFGIEYAFYSEDEDVFQANCVNVNCNLRDSGRALVVNFSMSSIYEEIDLFNLNYSHDDWEERISDGKYICRETVRLISEFIEKTEDQSN